jgi:predicted permease
MQSLFSLTGPIFALIAIGYLAVSYKLVPKEGVAAFGRYLVTFAIPAALFKALGERDLAEIIQPDYLLIYGIGSMIPFAILFLVARKMRNRPLDQSAIIAMGGSFSNTLMIGYPIIYQLFGAKALVPFALTLMVENLIMIPLVLTLAELQQNKKDHVLKTLGRTFAQLLKTPIIMGIILGLASSALALQAPAPVLKIIDMLAASVGAVALFAVGGNLVGIRFQGMALDLSQIVATKLIIHPLAVITCLYLGPTLDPTLTAVALILSAMPMFGIYSAIGERYNMGGLCAAALIPATLLSFITINLAVFWTSAG